MKVLRKKTQFLVSAGLVLAVVCVLTLTGCPKEPEEDQIDSRLVASWTNNEAGGMKKEFTINSDGTFTASINPTYVGAYNEAYGMAYAAAIQGGETAAHAAGLAAGAAAIAGLAADPNTSDAATRWTVTGKLVKDEGDIYIMNNLHEISDPPKPASIEAPEAGDANSVLFAFNQKVKIEFTDGNTFTFESAESDDLTNAFFGGTYVKK
jgi:hypothetical protein